MRNRRRRQQRLNKILNMIGRETRDLFFRHLHMMGQGGRNRRWRMRVKAMKMTSTIDGWRKAFNWKCEVTEDD